VTSSNCTNGKASISTTRTEVGANRGSFGIAAKVCLGRLILSTLVLDPEIHMIPDDTHLLIGALMFEGMDQIDLTWPFEALSRVPNSTYRIYAKAGAPVRDLNGLRLIPDAALEHARRSYREITAQREETPRRIAARLGIVVAQ
jgi:hypothetical protein